jgi:predicted HicB family RNase H-like nuclease
MNTMTHGGYTARIEFATRADTFVGHLLGLRGIGSFHGGTTTPTRRLTSRVRKRPQLT